MKFKMLLSSMCLLLLFTLPCQANGKGDLQKVEAQIAAFYDEMKKQHEFSAEQLDLWFNEVTVDERILNNIKRPAEKVLTWSEYRNIFIKQDRIEQGVSFWNSHADLLQQANQKYGVPIEIIVGLIGIETRYGKIMGKYDIFRSLYTLAFHYPRRSAFFSRELQSFLVLARDQNWQPTQMKGSYAGAMGFGQFMPSSYQAYAVDFDGDGKIHLVNNIADAIGSVANYISRHGWKPEQPIMEKVSLREAAEPKLPKSIKPKTTLSELETQGVMVPADKAPETKALLYKLVTDQDQYWLGYHNFYVISRYNPRIYYTQVVVELAQQIRQAFDSSQGN